MRLHWYNNTNDLQVSFKKNLLVKSASYIAEDNLQKKLLQKFRQLQLYLILIVSEITAKSNYSLLFQTEDKLWLNVSTKVHYCFPSQININKWNCLEKNATIGFFHVMLMKGRHEACFYLISFNIFSCRLLFRKVIISIELIKQRKRTLSDIHAINWINATFSRWETIFTDLL